MGSARKQVMDETVVERLKRADEIIRKHLYTQAEKVEDAGQYIREIIAELQESAASPSDRSPVTDQQRCFECDEPKIRAALASITERSGIAANVAPDDPEHDPEHLKAAVSVLRSCRDQFRDILRMMPADNYEEMVRYVAKRAHDEAEAALSRMEGRSNGR